MTTVPPPRVLHLLKWLPRGGIETWLTHVFAHSDPAVVRHEVLLMQNEIGPYEDRVRAAGVPIHILPMGSKIGWFGALYRFLRRQGPFDVFHAHVDNVIAGPAIAVAAAAGVPVRIIHNHAAKLLGADYQKLEHRAREAVGTAFAAHFATRRIGISEMSIALLAGADWRNQPNCSVLLYGFDYTPNRGAGERAAALRDTLRIAPGAKVIGHVGRFDSQKNHRFLIEVFSQFHARRPDAVLVLIGRGPLRPQVESQIAAAGLADNVRIIEGTDDVAAHMAMFDAFAFPSFSEGLGIVVLESQAAGTPVLMSDNLPREVIVIDEGVRTLPLAAGAEAWAGELHHLANAEKPDPAAWLARVETSGFGMQRCVADLDSIYRGDVAKAR